MLNFDDVLGEYTTAEKRRRALAGRERARLHRLQEERIARYYAVNHVHPGANRRGRVVAAARRNHVPQGSRSYRLTDVPVSGWDTDEELGILPFLGALASVAGPVISGITSLFGGGGGEAPAPSPAAAAGTVPPAPQLSATGSAGAGLSADGLKGIVREIVSTVGSPVRGQVQDAIRDVTQAQKAGQADMGVMLADIVKKLGPAISAQLKSVDHAATQRQATSEHKRLVNSEKRWKSNAAAQTAILNRLNQVENSLGGAVLRASANTRKVGAAYGIPSSKI